MDNALRKRMRGHKSDTIRMQNNACCKYRDRVTSY